MKALGHPNFVVKSYSKVIMDHVEKESEARKPEMRQYLEAVRAMEKHFKGFTAIHIPRSQNDEADKLANAAAQKEALPPGVFYEKITKPSTKQIKEKQINAILSKDWRSPIMAYLRGHFEPADEKDEKQMFQRARSYTIFEGELYKSGVVAPWLKCIPISEGRDLMQEIHSGLCRSHIVIRSLVSKAFRQGFFWPSMLKDAEQIVKICEGC